MAQTSLSTFYDNTSRVDLNNNAFISYTGPSVDWDFSPGPERNTSTSNITSPSRLDITSFIYINALIRASVGVLAIFGNFLTVMCIVYYEHLRTCTNSLVAALALCDLIGGITSLLHAALNLIPMSYNIWLWLCSVESAIGLFAAGANVYCILLISVDRLLFIIYPLCYFSIVTQGRVMAALFVMIVVVWSQITYLLQLKPNNIQAPLCATTVFGRNMFLTIEFYGLTFITAVIYGVIGLVANKQSRAIAMDLNTEMAQMIKKERKVTKMLGMILGIYLLCYIPNTFTLTMMPYIPEIYRVMVLRVSTWFWWTNSWVNPFIYAWKNQGFRHGIKSLLGIPHYTVEPATNGDQGRSS